MKFLPHPYQEKAIEFGLERPHAGFFLRPGQGKTAIILAIAKLLKRRGMFKGALVLAPLRPTYLVWPAEVRKWDEFAGLSMGILHGSRKDLVLREKHDLYLMNYEGLDWLARELPKLKAWPFDMLVADECFPGDTLVTTPSGNRPISELREGDFVTTPFGPRKVLRSIRRTTTQLVELTLNEKTIRCTPEHPVFTERGWLPASETEGWEIFDRAAVCALRETALGTARADSGQGEAREAAVLLKILQDESDVGDDACGKKGRLWEALQRTVRRRFFVEQGSTPPGIRQAEVVPITQDVGTLTWGAQAGQWDRSDSRRGATAKGLAGQLYLELRRSAKAVLRAWLPHPLQTGFWQHGNEDWGRGGWVQPRKPRTQRKGPQEGTQVGRTRVVRVTHLEPGDIHDVWNLEVEGCPFYFAGGILVHNCTRLKHTNTQRFKILKPMLPRFKRRYILTGTPAPNGLMDLFGQAYVMDLGASLGPYITHYRMAFFNAVNHGNYNEWFIKDGAEEQIYARLAPRVFRLSGDIKLPPLTVNDVWVDLPPRARAIYDQLEEQFRVDFMEGRVTAANSAVASMKCRQVANGGIYLDGTDKEWKNIHDAKAEAVAELVEELSGDPALVSYEFHHDLDRLRATLGKDVPHLGGGVSPKRAQEIERAWNAGELPVLLGQPQSVAHGLNLQAFGRTIIWAGLTWNYEDYDQFISRVRRQGQKRPVIMHRVLARNTVDEVMLRVLAAKGSTEGRLMTALEDYWKRKP